MKRFAACLVLSLSLTSFLAACDNAEPPDLNAGANDELTAAPAEEYANPALARAATRITRARSMDDVFGAVNGRMRRFGGFIPAADGYMDVWMQRHPGNGQDRPEVVKHRIMQILRHMENVDHIRSAMEPMPFRIQEGQYEALDLLAWRVAIAEGDMPGLRELDMDESLNRVRVGLEDLSGLPAAEARLAELGVPRDAVVFFETLPVTEFSAAPSTLTSYWPDRVGGIQMSYREGSFQDACTLGFNVLAGTVRGFITNSHCTSSSGLSGVQSAQFYQPLYDSSRPEYYVGTEYRDGTLFRSTSGFSSCPSGRDCRYSDAAMVRYQSGNSLLGRIARTTGYSLTSPNLTVNQSSPYFFVNAEIPYPQRFALVEKVGRSTGWTQGNVTATCVDKESPRTVGGQKVFLLCQEEVSLNYNHYPPATGDSGAPVFILSGSNATLVGILWGGPVGTRVYYMSSMENIRDDLALSFSTF